MCSMHQTTEQRHQRRDFYRKKLRPEERRALADANELEGLDEEIALLRVLIRRVLAAGDVDVTRRVIATLHDLMKSTHKLDKPNDELGEWRDHVAVDPVGLFHRVEDRAVPRQNSATVADAFLAHEQIEIVPHRLGKFGLRVEEIHDVQLGREDVDLDPEGPLEIDRGQEVSPHGFGPDEEQVAVLPDVEWQSVILGERGDHPDAGQRELDVDRARELMPEPPGAPSGRSLPKRLFAFQEEDRAGPRRGHVVRGAGPDRPSSDHDNVGCALHLSPV